MTRIDFYSNSPSRLHTACQLAAKAFSRNTPVALFAPDAQIARSLDRMLWTFQATSFVPHCLAHERLAAETPILIVSNLEQSRQDELVINLAGECPAGFGRFRRLIEVVGLEDEERRLARLRWRFYKERGYEVNHRDLAGA